MWCVGLVIILQVINVRTFFFFFTKMSRSYLFNAIDLIEPLLRSKLFWMLGLQQ